MKTASKIYLRPGREKSLIRKHPWVFSGAVRNIEGSPADGEVADVVAHDGKFLARGYYSGKSQITVRALTFDAAEKIDEKFISKTLARAVALRLAGKKAISSDAYRLVSSESDCLPGVIIDIYGSYAVCQFSTAGAECMKSRIVAALKDFMPLKGIYDRSDVDSRKIEGLLPVKGVLAGEEPPDLIEIVENGMRLLVDVKNGHKTGFYLDQRDSRKRMGAWCDGAEVLNVFSYTGGFSVSALMSGAVKVTNIDSSGNALKLCLSNAELNGFAPDRTLNIDGDAFRVLRDMGANGQEYDVIVLDPPKFAESKSQLMKAARGYKDVNMIALRLLKPGGKLFTFSCSGLMEPDLFQKIVADAALDARCGLQFVERLSQPCDHPILSTFPESWYLKGFICIKP